MNRQNKLLLSLFGLLVLALGYAYWMMPVQRRIERPQDATDARALSQNESADRPVDKNRLLVELLEKNPSKYQGYSRDLFNFYVPKPVRKPAPPVKKPEPKAVVKPPPPAVTPVVRQQLARFTFLGFLDKNEVRTVFLTRGDELFLVQENDTFGDNQQFTAAMISADKMSIRQAGDNRLIEIPLVEKEPLVPTMQQAGESAPTAAPPRPALPTTRPDSSPPLLKR